MIQTKNQNKLSILGFRGQIIELKLGQKNVFLMTFYKEIPKNRSLCTGGAVSSSNYFLKSSTLA